MTPTETNIEPPDARAQMDWADTGKPLLDISAWMPGEIKAITPLVDRLLQLVEESQCLPGDKLLLELALREALYNAVVHGDDPAKLLQIHCRCERKSEMYVVVKDQRQGSALIAVPDYLAAKSPQAEHAPGILQLKPWMDQLSFEQKGAELHMWIKNRTRYGNEIAKRERDKPSRPTGQYCATRSGNPEALSFSWRPGD